ncbi:xanthine dehydrogenase family protein [Candidatus Sumerlaeota bacterium]|nr:xanthine dehydrogenase family protein [Candidatus Sumerlaeota bacterium]
MPELHIAGKPLPRPDAPGKTMGYTQYLDDWNLPGMLHARIYYSPKPHALIRRIDLRKALSHPGIHSILTARDIPGKNFIPMMKDDWTFLAEKKAIYPGEPVALIIGNNRESVCRARALIQVEYEDLKPVFDPEESLQTGAPQVNPLGNLIAYHKIRKGNIEKGVSEADVVIEGIYETPYQEHAYLETLGYIAVFHDKEIMRVYGTMQCPFYVQNAVASILGMPQNSIQVIQTPTGGAFGGKEDMPSLFGGLAALAAYKTGKPVKLVLDRRDDILLSSKRHPSRSYYRIGAKKNGALTFCEVKVYLDAGAYATLTPAVLWRCAVHGCGCYRIPHVKVDAYAGATNKIPCGAFRGFGSPQVVFAMERQMDKLAQALGIDPLHLREINCLRKGDETVTGQKLPFSVGLSETISKARSMSKWSKKWRQYPLIKGEKRRGLGCATFLYGVGLGAAGKKLDHAEAHIRIKSDGSVVFSVGTTDMGQGMETVLTQIAAEGLGGIPMEKIRMLPVDTFSVEDSGPTVASRATYTSGTAILSSCEKIITTMKKTASKLLSCKPEEILLEKGCFFRIKSPKAKQIGKNADNKKNAPFLTFEEMASECFSRHIPLSEYGYFDSPPTSWEPETGQGKAYVTYSFATQIAELELDMETGEIELQDIWAVHDIGKAINPQNTEGQIEGGVVQGIGYALMEFISFNEKGMIQNPSFSTYIIPTSKDVPRIHTAIVEVEYPEGPYGAKGFGETPLMGVAGCIANAVVNASGIDISRIPILPEYILQESRKL